MSFALAAAALAQSPLQRSAGPAPVRMEPDSRPAVPSSEGRLYGSIPAGEPAANFVLSLREALRRALKYNLALVEGGEDIELRRAERLRALSQILPSLNLRPSISAQQVNLAAFGIRLPGAPSVVGPFRLYDVRGYAAEQLGLEGLRNYQAGRLGIRAAELSLRDARDQVVTIVVQLYLQAIAASARIDAARIQAQTAETLYNQAVDRKNAGVVAGIDVVRAQVEMQSEQQRLIFYEGEFDKQKLALARTIGLPLGQQFQLGDLVPYAPLPAEITLDRSLNDAHKTRADFQSAETLVRAAELAESAARAGRLPSVALTADYGANGPATDHMHGSFTAAAGVNIPLFEGGRIQANVEQARALLHQRQGERDNLRGRIDAEVRSAFIDLNSSSRQVEVARSNLDLARQQVRQAQDRFAAGVTNNIEVVQAQDALAVANENYIASLHAYNTAKASLARARGDAEESILRFLNVP